MMRSRRYFGTADWEGRASSRDLDWGIAEGTGSGDQNLWVGGLACIVGHREVGKQQNFGESRLVQHMVAGYTAAAR